MATQSEPAASATDESGEGGKADEQQNHARMEPRRYLRFAAMIATSTVVMFLLTYTNAYAWGHVRWSEERVYMALLMGGAMAVVMLAFMWSMYSNRKVNLAIFGVAFALMGGAVVVAIPTVRG